MLQRLRSLFGYAASTGQTPVPDTILGKTGLTLSRMGFGLGGTRLGGFKHSPRRGCRQVRSAYRQGIRYFDTAHKYNTEVLLAKALETEARGDVIISTKLPDLSILRNRSITSLVHDALQRLDLKQLDICFFHGIPPHDYVEVREQFLPPLMDLKSRGIIKAIGLTETFTRDMRHQMLEMALADRELWDVFMVGYNFLNQSAARTILPRSTDQGIGLIGMFAVRNTFSQPERFRKTLDDLAAQGQIEPHCLNHPLLKRLLSYNSQQLAEYAYRFVLSEKRIHSVLMGTSSPEHLQQNIATLHAPLLPEGERADLQELFKRVDSISGH